MLDKYCVYWSTEWRCGAGAAHKGIHVRDGKIFRVLLNDGEEDHVAADSYQIAREDNELFLRFYRDGSIVATYVMASIVGWAIEDE